METKMFVVAFIMNLLSPSSQSTVMNLRREMNEELPEGSVLDDLISLYGLAPKEMMGKYFEKKGNEQLQMTGQRIHLSDDFIRVNRDNGLITLKKKIDRDALCGKSSICVLKIQVMTLPQRYFRLLNLDIVIKDINDNQPLFPNSPIYVNVSEKTQINDVIDLDQYQARDADIGNNSFITYDLTPNRYFFLQHFYDEAGNSHLRLTVRKKLDFESDSYHKFQLTATDHGTLPISSQSILVINIMDINDIAPRFDRQNYVIFASENVVPGTVLANVSASDFDSGMNGRVLYSVVLENSNSQELLSLLSVDPDTGSITLLKQLKQETDNGLSFQVEATDMGVPPLSSRALVTLEIEDVNNNAPVLEINFLVPTYQNKVLLSESAPVDTYVGFVIGSDKDSNNNGEVELELATTNCESEVFDQFTLGNDGLLLTKKSFDRETVNQYCVMITACDKGNPRRCSFSNITVEILDENDNTPVFFQSAYNITVSEAQEIGTEVITVAAYDNDKNNSPANKLNELHQVVPSLNGEIRYSLFDKENTFSIDPATGQVTLRRSLDRERLSSWEVAVIAKDLGEPANEKTCWLHITVTDVNDNPPIFINPSGENTTVFASIKINETFFRVNTVDYDKDDSANVTISVIKIDDIKANNFNKPKLFQAFVLNPKNGELFINRSYKPLEELLGKHYVRLQARDHGMPPLKSETSLIVDVTDWLTLPTVDPKNPQYSSGFSSTSSINILHVIVLSLVSLILIIGVGAFVAVLRKNRNEQTNQIYDCRKAETEDKLRQTQTSKQDCSSEERLRPSSCNVAATSCESEKLFDASSNHGSLRKEPRPSLSSPKYSGTPYQIGTSQDSLLCSARHYDVLSSTSGKPMTPNKSNGSKHPDNDDQTTIQQLDMDSGRGDSEVESSYLQGINDIKTVTCNATNQRYKLGKYCTSECTLYGHSDSCWMPDIVQSETSFPSVGNSNTTKTIKNPSLHQNQIKNLLYGGVKARDNPRKSLCLAVTGEESRHLMPFNSEPTFPYHFHNDIKRHSRVDQLIGKADSPYSSVFGSNSSLLAPISGRCVTSVKKEKKNSKSEKKSLFMKDHYLTLGVDVPSETKNKIKSVEI